MSLYGLMSVPGLVTCLLGIYNWKEGQNFYKSIETLKVHSFAQIINSFLNQPYVISLVADVKDYLFHSTTACGTLIKVYFCTCYSLSPINLSLMWFLFISDCDWMIFGEAFQSVLQLDHPCLKLKSDRKEMFVRININNIFYRHCHWSN